MTDMTTPGAGECTCSFGPVDGYAEEDPNCPVHSQQQPGAGEADRQTIADLRADVTDSILWVSKTPEELRAELNQQAQTIAELRKALEESMAIAVRDGRASAFILKKPLRDQAWYDRATKPLAAIAATEAPHVQE